MISIFEDGDGRVLVIKNLGTDFYAYLSVPDGEADREVWLCDAESMTDDILVDWHPEDRAVAVYLDGSLLAILCDYERIGRNRSIEKSNERAQAFSAPPHLSNGYCTYGNREMLQFRFEEKVAVIERDAFAAYAYLYNEMKLVSYVWLFNILAAPAGFPETIGTPGHSTPNATAKSGFEIPALRDIEAVIMGDNQSVGIYVRGRRHALLAAGEKPGLCVLATETNALAVAIG